MLGVVRCWFMRGIMMIDGFDEGLIEEDCCLVVDYDDEGVDVVLVIV